MVLASCVCDADNYIYHIGIHMVSLKQVQQLARLALVIFFLKQSAGKGSSPIG
jgi:hypothetical protein